MRVLLALPGASLAGDAVTFSLSYDAGLLEAEVNAGAGAHYLDPSYYDAYDDYAGDSAFTESVTINSQTLTIASYSGFGSLEGCTAACGANGVFATSAQLGSSAVIQTVLNTTQNYSTGDDLLSQTEVDALVGVGVTTGVIHIYEGASEDTLAIGNVYAESSATPEPTTGVSLALGFGMAGLLKRRRSAR